MGGLPASHEDIICLANSHFFKKHTESVSTHMAFVFAGIRNFFNDTETPQTVEAFRICRSGKSREMIECIMSHEWRRAEYLEVTNDEVGDRNCACPVCDWRVEIPRTTQRPRLEDFKNRLLKIETLLVEIVKNVQDFCDRITPSCRPITTSEYAGEQRHYPRELEVTGILLSLEASIREQLQQLSPDAPKPPPGGNDACDLYFCQPPDFYPIVDEEAQPPQESANSDLKPRETQYDDSNIYDSRWFRGNGKKREAWCGLCQPARWISVAGGNFLRDRQSKHGISSATKTRFESPEQFITVDGAPDLWKGLCRSCANWVSISKAKDWFNHASKCHLNKGKKRSTCSSDNSGRVKRRTVVKPSNLVEQGPEASQEIRKDIQTHGASPEAVRPIYSPPLKTESDNALTDRVPLIDSNSASSDSAVLDSASSLNNDDAPFGRVRLTDSNGTPPNKSHSNDIGGAVTDSTRSTESNIDPTEAIQPNHNDSAITVVTPLNDSGSAFFDAMAMSDNCRSADLGPPIDSVLSDSPRYQYSISTTNQGTLHQVCDHRDIPATPTLQGSSRTDRLPVTQNPFMGFPSWQHQSPIQGDTDDSFKPLLKPHCQIALLPVGDYRMPPRIMPCHSPWRLVPNQMFQEFPNYYGSEHPRDDKFSILDTNTHESRSRLCTGKCWVSAPEASYIHNQFTKNARTQTSGTEQLYDYPQTLSSVSRDSSDKFCPSGHEHFEHMPTFTTNIFKEGFYNTLHEQDSDFEPDQWH